MISLKNRKEERYLRKKKEYLKVKHLSRGKKKKTLTDSVQSLDIENVKFKFRIRKTKQKVPRDKKLGRWKYWTWSAFCTSAVSPIAISWVSFAGAPSFSSLHWVLITTPFSPTYKSSHRSTILRPTRHTLPLETVPHSSDSRSAPTGIFSFNNWSFSICVALLKYQFSEIVLGEVMANIGQKCFFFVGKWILKEGMCKSMRKTISWKSIVSI